MSTSSPLRADVIEPYEAVYEFRRSMARAETTYTIEKAVAEYVVTTVVKAKGAAKLLAPNPAREESKFRLENGVIIPLSYDRSDGDDKSDDDASVEFDWERGIASGVENGRTAEFDISPGKTFDILTAELAVRSALARGDREVSFDVIEGAEKVRYTYHPEGAESLEIGGETVETVVYRLDRQSRRMLYYWFAPARDYLVVKMQQRAGDEVKGTITLKSVE